MKTDIWKALGPITNGLGVVYKLDRLDGDLPDYEETQLRGAAYATMERVSDTVVDWHVNTYQGTRASTGEPVYFAYSPWPVLCYHGPIRELMPVTQMRPN